MCVCVEEEDATFNVAVSTRDGKWVAFSFFLFSREAINSGSKKETSGSALRAKILSCMLESL